MICAPLSLPARALRRLRVALLWLLHALSALEERATFWWATGRWAAADWAQAALDAVAAPAWVPAALAWARAPRRVGGAAARRRGAPPAPARTAAVVVAEVVPGDMPVERVAAVVHWCAQAGITRLFVYDPTGFLKESAPSLRAHLARAVCVRVGWAGPPVPPPAALDAPALGRGTPSSRGVLSEVNVRRGASAGGGKPGDDRGGAAPSPSPSALLPPTPPALVVRLLSARDAEAPLLAAADAPLTPASLDASLAAAAGPAALTEPDVVLVYGATFTLAGYPPWPLRHSEIYSMGPLKRASWGGVRGALARYQGTSQRFGR